MKRILTSGSGLIPIVLVFALGVSCCKKDPTPDGPQGSRRDLTNDSLFLYAKEIYFWNSTLPSYESFNPRKYNTETKDLDNYENNLNNIVMSSGSPEYYGGEIKYSYIEDIADQNPNVVVSLPGAKASVDLEGNGNDIGIRLVAAVQMSSSAYRLYIQQVELGSPAALNGLTRGAYITKINGASIGSVANFSTEANLVNNTIYDDPVTIKLEGIKTDGNTFNVTLNKTSYKSNPVLKTNVLTVGTKKIGYLAYTRFSNKANSEAELRAAFADFVAKGVTDLIVDFRYNGGGYVSTAELLVNLIAPKSANGVMYVEHFNETLKNRKTADKSILSNQPWLDASGNIIRENGRMLTYADADYSPGANTAFFAKEGSLDIQNVTFIVSRRSASASELVINCLKTKMNVKTVGYTTYGKPIGFFPMRLENKYDVYYSLFETKNSAGEGGYYRGMVVDREVLNGSSYYDPGDYDWGNPLDANLKIALEVITGTSPVVISSANKLMGVSGMKGASASPKVLNGLDHEEGFVGMIENRLKMRR